MKRALALASLAACHGAPHGAAPDARASDATIDTTTDAPAGTVVPYDCTTGSGAVRFVGETAPPATLAPWAHATTSVTWANCGTTTWSSSVAPPNAVKLGPAAPHDLDVWTPQRMDLPADVPPAHAVTIVLALHAPPLTGTHAYAFQLVQDGVAWLGSPSPAHAIDVEAAAASAIAICNGVTADPSGAVDASAAIQTCLNATPAGGTLALPPGIYRLAHVVTIDHAMTLESSGATGDAASCLEYAAPRCAVLRADATVVPSAASTRGFVRLGTLATRVATVSLDHVVVDGNRAARLGGAAASACASRNGDGINVGANCDSCTIVGSVSARAVCGSGMEWDGDNIVVRGSVFWGNGDHATQNMWSDGLTIHKSDGGVVDSCRFIDSSDVGLISGGGTNAAYTNNQVLQLSQPAFAAMMLDNFNSSALGDHVGARLANNFVACPGGCHFGIEAGPHPWYASPNIQGGTITANTVVGANIEINAQGAGTASAPTVISNNTLGATPSSAAFQCGNVSGLSPLNVSSDSIVDLQGGSATGHIAVPCP